MNSNDEYTALAVRASWQSEQALRHMIGRDSYALPSFKG
jgi:hypothetical protein